MDSVPSSSQQESRLFCEGSTTSTLLFLLPPCLILLALDLALRRSQQPLITSEEESSLIPSHPLQRLSLRTQEILSNFRELERQFFQIQSRNKALSLEIAQCKTLSPTSPTSPISHSSCESRLPVVVSPSPTPRPRSRRRNKQISLEFEAFCERLVQANRIWAQEREIKKLKEALKSSTESHSSASFTSFCEQLVLTNEIRKKNEEIERLREEQDRMKRSRVAMVTRAAKQMVLDVQKERMIEEFVKDVIEESAQSRRSLEKARVEHEREIREVVEEWRKENKMLRAEVERLRMARDAKVLEQDISNDLEDRLFEQVRSEKEKEEQLATPTAPPSVEEAPVAEAEDAETVDSGYNSDDADTYLEEMSIMSASTCVGSPSPSPMKQPRVQLSLKASPRRRVDSGGYVGFSFNPLFFGNRGEIAPRPAKGVDMKAKERLQSQASLKKPGVSPRPSLMKSAWRV